MMTADRQVRNDGLGGAAGGEIAVAVGEAQHSVGVSDIDPLRIGPGWIEGNAERIGQAGSERRRSLRLAAVRAQYADAARIALGDEYVAVRRGADDARSRQTGSKEIDFKAVWDDWLLIGSVHCSDDIPRGLGKVRRGQILRPDQPPHSGAVGVPVAKCR